jgi:Sec-independent protein translocase protein TatA
MRKITIILVLFQLIGCAPYKLSEMHANMATTLGQLHKRMSDLHSRVSELHDRHDKIDSDTKEAKFYWRITNIISAITLVVIGIGKWRKWW